MELVNWLPLAGEFSDSASGSDAENEDVNPWISGFTGEDKWRGWQGPDKPKSSEPCDKIVKGFTPAGSKPDVMSLVEISSQLVAEFIPFEKVEQLYPPVPNDIQIRIAFWSFPDNEDDIRLYSCLANSNTDEFGYGQKLFAHKAVKDCVQIGFNLCGNVYLGSIDSLYNVVITFGKKKIITCNCTCKSNIHWCSHVVAVCLHRINTPEEVELRPPVSESLSSLKQSQIQKFAQYLINEIPQHILPSAQRLLDMLVSPTPNAINTTDGAPDPTSGSSVNEYSTWFLDDKILHNNIKRSLNNFIIPTPSVICDVTSLSNYIPPLTAEWTNLLRPFQGSEPEGMWNLLSIVREMYRKNDGNALQLLEVLTEEILESDQVMLWWFNTDVEIQRNYVNKENPPITSSRRSCSASYAAAFLCDEVVTLWRLAATNRNTSSNHKVAYKIKFNEWQCKIFLRVAKYINVSTRRLRFFFNSDKKSFIGFKPACNACDINWEDYPLASISYGTSCNNHSSCVHVHHTTTASQFTEDHFNWNEASRANSYKSSSDVQLPDYIVVDNKRFFCVSADQNRNMTRQQVVRNYFSNHELRSTNEADSDLNESANALSNAVLRTPSRAESISNSGSESTEESDESSDQVITPGPQDENDSNNLASIPISLDDQFVPISITELVHFDIEWQTMFARAESLYAFGHINEACELCIKLVDQFILKPPNLMIDLPPPKIKKKRSIVNPVCHQYSFLASEILRKCYFLCSVLAERKDYYMHAFKIGLYGVEIARRPASTKSLEVKMLYQEGEILKQLKRLLPLNQEQAKILLNKARILRDGLYNARGESLLPFNLALYIFDGFVLHPPLVQVKGVDESFGFEAALGVLGMRTIVYEKIHPLLCEGMRRQRGDLAVQVLLRYKNNPPRLALVMDKLMDRDIHPILQSNVEACWYQTRDYKNLLMATMKKVVDNNKKIKFVPLSVNAKVTYFHGNSDMNINSMAFNLAQDDNRSNSTNGSNRDICLGPNRLNMATEAYAHYLFEMAKEIKDKVSGSWHSNNVYVSFSTFSNQPHRGLLMCAFQLALYSLGLRNIMSPNWRTRNYCPQVTWIAEHAIGIGTPAAYFLLATWEDHLTPSEAANMAFEIGKSPDITSVEAAAQLALSCLKHSANLHFNEIVQLIDQCKDQSDHMMETACWTIESAAKSGNISSEVLFYLARYWFDFKANVFSPTIRINQHVTSSYRVGLLALAALEPNNSETGDHFSSTPPFKEHVLWVLQLSNSLGPNFTKQFCTILTKNVENPFILHDVTIETLKYTRHFTDNPTVFPALNSLVEKCRTQYIRLFYHAVHEVSTAEYPEFVNLLKNAYSVFRFTQEGDAMFKDTLQSLRRLKTCHKEIIPSLKNITSTVLN